MDVLLLAGLWMDGSAWDEVAPALESLGHRPVPITPAGSTLDDRLAAVLAAVDSAPDRPLVVGHSAACTLAWMAADARPARVAKVALIGGFPEADGELYAGAFEVVGDVAPFPGWPMFEGADSADLDDEAKRSFASRAVPVPAGVTRSVVRLHDERRFDVPVRLVCPEFSAAQAKDWIAGGHAPELARARHVTLVDIDSGHWPMLTRPAELARLLAAYAEE